MKTEVCVSCPTCQKMQNVTMVSASDEEMESIGHKMDRSYLFMGFKRCECGDEIIPTLVVLSGEEFAKNHNYK